MSYETLIEKIDTLISYSELHKAVQDYLNSPPQSNRMLCFQYNTCIKKVVTYDFSKVTSMTSTFNGCTNLEIVKINARSATSYGSCFRGCNALHTVIVEKNSICATISITSPLLSAESVNNIIAGLFDNRGTNVQRSVTFDSAIAANLTQEQMDIITVQKGWTIG